MLAFLGTVLTAVIALIPALGLSSRRRMLSTLAQEVELHAKVDDPATKAQLREAMERSAGDYRARVLGLDAADRAKRLLAWMVPVFAVVAVASGVTILNATAIARAMGIAHSAVYWAVLPVYSLVFIGFTWLQWRAAALSKRRAG